MSSEAATHDIAQRLLSLATEEVLREKPVTEHTLSQFLQVAELGYKISQELDLQDPLEGINRDQILNWVTAQVTITQETATVMTDRSHQAWLYQNRDEIDWAYWTDYRNLLAANASFGPQVIQRLDEVTDEILDLIPYPRKSGAWDSRGLVMGNVQSGKTANYLGLICKAADAGYRVIIILTGMHNDLRSQTQKRVDEGFVGKDTQHGFLDAPEYGVGRIRSRSQMPVTFTSQLQNGDFSRSSAQSVGVPLESDQVKIFVVKKHTTVLKTLADWLKSAAAGSGDDPKIDQVPLLLIDDEADQASVNTARTWDPSDEDHDQQPHPNNPRPLQSVRVRRLHGHTVREHLHPAGRRRRPPRRGPVPPKFHPRPGTALQPHRPRGALRTRRRGRGTRIRRASTDPRRCRH